MSSGNGSESMWLERDVLPALAGTGKARVFKTSKWWSQIKTAGSAIYANRHYLSLYQSQSPDRLSKKSVKSPQIIGNVFVHPTAKVDCTAVVRSTFYKIEFFCKSISSIFIIKRIATRQDSYYIQMIQ